MLDDAVSYVAQDSHPAAERLLMQALEAAASLDVFSERGRVVPELDQPNVRQLLLQRYRLIYEVMPDEVQVLAFVHGAGISAAGESIGDGFHANNRLQRPPAAGRR